MHEMCRSKVMIMNALIRVLEVQVQLFAGNGDGNECSDKSIRGTSLVFGWK